LAASAAGPRRGFIASRDWSRAASRRRLGLRPFVFEGKEWLTTDIMLNTLAIIAIVGLFFEKVVFKTVDRMTVQRWGIVRVPE
jgi:hypothetical protein